MTKAQMIEKIEYLRELEQYAEEIKAEADAVKDELKSELLERDTEQLEVGKYILRWTSCLSNRFDSTAFKKTYAELYKAFTKQVSSKRFSISA